MAAVVEIPPEHCSTCPETRLRPGWDECPLPGCRKMDRSYRCPANHLTMATWHEHRIVPSERPRWHCAYEDLTSPS
ncbi:MAG TPA: hypothetical protein VH419_06310 [Nocardioidaceae bacterium]|jgi:hypothetical protein